MIENNTPERVLAVDVIVEDCGYGYAAHLLMSDGSRRFYSELKPTREEAMMEVTEKARTSARKIRDVADEADCS
ncbi:MAG: hypothetical protein RSP_18030 [Rhodanobacter sp.]